MNLKLQHLSFLIEQFIILKMNQLHNLRVKAPQHISIISKSFLVFHSAIFAAH